MNARIKAVSKVDYAALPLTTQAGRTALFIGITAGTVTQAEIEKAVLLDNEKRPYRKPVVAYGKRYISVRAAATSQLMGRSGVLISRLEFANRLNAEEKRIARLCNKDDTVGFYWAE